ncbi:MAG: MFS transporter [Bradymonadia bacterium]
MTTSASNEGPVSRWAIPTLLCASSLPILAGALVAPALPGIQSAFADVEGVGLWSRLMLTVPALAVALIALSAGWLVDAIGRRRTLVYGLVIYGVAGTSGLWLGSLHALLVGRLALGIGVAFIMTSATTLLADLVPGAARQRIMGIQAAFIGMGGLVFLLIGGALAEISWRWPFAVYGASWLVVLPALKSLPTGAKSGGQGRTPWGITPALLARCAAATLSMVLFYTVPVQLPFLLLDRFDTGGFASGAAIGVITLTSSSASLLYPKVRAKMDPAPMLALTFLLMGPGLMLIGADLGWTGVIVGLLVMGAGMGLLMPNLTTWTAEQASLAQRGRHMGALTMALFTGQFTSPLVTRPLQDSGAGTIFVVGGATALVASLVIALVGKRAGRAALT